MDKSGARSERGSHRDPMTIEEFLDFAETRPDGEKWELIEGVAVLSPTPSDFHQIIVGNIVTALNVRAMAFDASWIVLPGVGTKVPVSPNSLPAPDVMVKADAPTGAHTSDDALVLFEVFSPSNRKKDRDWRKTVYSSVPNCRHYVTIEQKRIEVVARDREAGWEPRSLQALEDVLKLPALGEIAIPLSELYRKTPLAKATTAKTRQRP